MVNLLIVATLLLAVTISNQQFQNWNSSWFPWHSYTRLRDMKPTRRFNGLGPYFRDRSTGGAPGQIHRPRPSLAPPPSLQPSFLQADDLEPPPQPPAGGGYDPPAPPAGSYDPSSGEEPSKKKKDKKKKKEKSPPPNGGAVQAPPPPPPPPPNGGAQRAPIPTPGLPADPNEPLPSTTVPPIKEPSPTEPVPGYPNSAVNIAPAKTEPASPPMMATAP